VSASGGFVLGPPGVAAVRTLPAAAAAAAKKTALAVFIRATLERAR
jgi:hypothetical protein